MTFFRGFTSATSLLLVSSFSAIFFFSFSSNWGVKRVSFILFLFIPISLCGEVEFGVEPRNFVLCPYGFE